VSILDIIWAIDHFNLKAFVAQFVGWTKQSWIFSVLRSGEKQSSGDLLYVYPLKIMKYYTTPSMPLTRTGALTSRVTIKLTYCRHNSKEEWFHTGFTTFKFHIFNSCRALYWTSIDPRLRPKPRTVGRKVALHFKSQTHVGKCDPIRSRFGFSEYTWLFIKLIVLLCYQVLLRP
jgi:hypothetical protein